MSSFEVGDRVYYSGPSVNSSWLDAFTATVIGVRQGLIDIKWDHGPYNYGHDPVDFSRRDSE